MYGKSEKNVEKERKKNSVYSRKKSKKMIIYYWVIKIDKPYYRIYRPYKNIKDTSDAYGYISDKRNCKNRKENIRYFNILQKEFMDILEYIELSDKNMETYSLKIYKVFLSVCTEIENNLKGILYSNNYKVGQLLNMKNDYFKLENILKLSKYKVKITITDYEKLVQPFKEWEDHEEYTPIEWYKDYNNLKHNRSDNIEKANLLNLTKAICALYILLYAQFYEYSKTIDSSNALSFFTDDGELLIEDGVSIIHIEEKPTWLEEEKYDFDWEKLKTEENPYRSIEI